MKPSTFIRLRLIAGVLTALTFLFCAAGLFWIRNTESPAILITQSLTLGLIVGVEIAVKVYLFASKRGWLRSM